MENVVLISLSKPELETIIKTAINDVLREKEKAEQKELLSAKELCSLLGISISTLNKWKAENKIPYKRMGKRNFYVRTEVMEALKDSNYKKLKELNV